MLIMAMCTVAVPGMEFVGATASGISNDRRRIWNMFIVFFLYNI